MPELPDITVYVEALRARVLDRRLRALRLHSPFVLRSVDPAPEAIADHTVLGVRRIGKRIVLHLEQELAVVVHLMIAGRLQWRDKAPSGRSRNVLAGFEFDDGHLVLTEAGTKRRASIHLVAGADALAAIDPGGIEVLDCPLDAFRERLCLRNHTLKRALTDPRLFSGIGNAYSDEILHRARLSPVAQTQKLDEAAVAALFEACREVLTEWTDRLREQTGEGFPAKVTAFRPEMAVHGRYREPCPVCGTRVQRIRYASNEVNYCPRCQTGGRLLADRALSRLLKKDWPRSIDELEAEEE